MSWSLNRAGLEFYRPGWPCASGPATTRIKTHGGWNADHGPTCFLQYHCVTLNANQEVGNCPTVRGAGDLTAFIPAEGGGELEITVQATGFSASWTLARIAPRDEPRSTDNVTVLWQQPGGGIHTDIWADNGLVFAPRFDGVIEIMTAEDGKIVGQTESLSAVLYQFREKRSESI